MATPICFSFYRFSLFIDGLKSPNNGKFSIFREIKLIMKKTFIAIAALSLFVLTACGGSSKGNWTDEDKEKAKAEMNSERATLESVIGAEKTDQFIDCVVEKIEQEYDGFESADSDEAGIEKIAEECMKDLM
ncbi:hypothetical protein N9089_00605 [Crocinitomicaceae bacterium]|nr:hypothetical protein [Crocinitomicaceae bacterium]